MAAISQALVREYFELHQFFVRQHRKYVSPTRGAEEDDIDFFVLNPKPQARSNGLPFILTSADLRRVEKAVVVVKGWHTETFSPSRLANAPEIFRFVEQKVFEQAVRAFALGAPPLKILVIPALPQQAPAREESISLLKARGIDAVIPFYTILAKLVAAVEPNRNYEKSDLLQMLRILKNYDLLKDPQLELFKVGGKKRSRE